MKGSLRHHEAILRCSCFFHIMEEERGGNVTLETLKWLQKSPELGGKRGETVQSGSTH